MKGKELAGYLLENPEWEVEFWFTQMPDEIDGAWDRSFTVIDVGDNIDRKVAVLTGEEVENV